MEFVMEVCLALYCMTMFLGLALLFTIPIVTTSCATFYVASEKLSPVFRVKFKQFIRLLFFTSSNRLPLKIPLIIETEKNQRYFTHSSDLSANGLFINMLADTISIGTKLKIKISIGKGHFVRCYARAVRINAGRGPYPTGTGLQFDRFEKRDFEKLVRYLKKQDYVYRVKSLSEHLWLS